jgi:dTDP-glucose pyrophosphorylase
VNTADPSYTISQCLVILDSNRGLGVPVVDGSGQLVGILTDGDIRRCLINGGSLSDNCMVAANAHYFYVQNKSEIKKEHHITYAFIPVLDKGRKVVEFVTRSSPPIIDGDKVAGVIMAGGFGTRMQPLTNTIPKPLLDLHGTSLIERIIGRFAECGLSKIYICVNYLAEKIMDKLGDGARWDVEIDYIVEIDPLGTGGGLGLIENCRHQTLIVTNGDIYTELDFANLLQFHTDTRSELTMAAVQYSVSVPFGVIEAKDGLLCNLLEKPVYKYRCNSGIYAIEREILRLIPASEYFDMTDLVYTVQQKSGMVAVYDMSDYWADIGNVAELEKNRKMLDMLNRSRVPDAV